MTEKYIEAKIGIAKRISKLHGTCWLFSNGEQLKTAADEADYCDFKDRGYWVAMLFNGGHQVDL